MFNYRNWLILLVILGGSTSRLKPAEVAFF